MAPRSYWKGYLKLSLVTCAVTLSPATSENNKVRFHTLNRKTGERIYTRYIDGVTGKTVKDDDIVKGYERADNEFVLLEDEDLEAVQLESTRTIAIEEFIASDSIEWVYYDSPYFLTPADEVGEEAFSVIREAMEQSGVVGISRLVLGNRERAVMLQPWGQGIILWTLRFGDEVRDEDEYFSAVDDEKPTAKLQKMVEQIIKDRTVAWDASLLKDPVQARIKDIIKAKRPKKGKAKPKAVAKSDDDQPSNVIDLMEALKKSLEGKPKGKGN